MTIPTRIQIPLHPNWPRFSAFSGLASDTPEVRNAADVLLTLVFILSFYHSLFLIVEESRVQYLESTAFRRVESYFYSDLTSIRSHVP